VIAGVLGCAALAPRVSEHRAERSYMLVAVMVTVAGSLLCALSSSLGLRTVALLAFGSLLLTALPIVLTECERLAGPLAGSAGAIVWLAGNLGGLAVALLVQLLVHHPMLAFTAMAAVAGLGLPLALRLPASVSARDEAALP
jgi:MFS family permease